MILFILDVYSVWSTVVAFTLAYNSGCEDKRVLTCKLSLEKAEPGTQCIINHYFWNHNGYFEQGRKMISENRPHWRKQRSIFQLPSFFSYIRIGTLCKCLFGSLYLWSALEKKLLALLQLQVLIILLEFVVLCCFLAWMHDFVKKI